MKKTIIIVSLVTALLAGCQNTETIKTALNDALIVGKEVEKAERAKCESGANDGSCETADRISVWLNAGQQIYDTGSYSNNCDIMLSVTDIAYDWLSEKYPEKVEYRIPVALLRSRLLTYCEVTE
jgi:hypothetical protein